MWLLLMVLLAAPSGLNNVTVLNAFSTYEDCKPERDRIGFEMAASYPYENNFSIVCEFRASNGVEASGDSQIAIYFAHSRAEIDRLPRSPMP